MCLWRMPAVDAPVASWTHSKKIGCVAFSPDGATALFADLFGEVHGVLLSESGATPTLVLGHLSPVSHLAFSPSGGSLITADREGHVRGSCWPHAFVIECYYLSHTSPLQLVLPLCGAPLLVTAANEGREVCYWAMHRGALLGRTSAENLVGRGAADTTGSSTLADDVMTSTSIIGGCEVSCQSLLAFLPSDRHAVAFVDFKGALDGATASLLPVPELACPLTTEPVAIAYSTPAVTLCVLVATGNVLVLPAKSRGFDVGAALSLSPPAPVREVPSVVDDDGRSTAEQPRELE